MSERTAAATARRRADSELKRQRILTIARAFIDRGQDFSWESLARAADVNPGFLHRAPGLKEKVREMSDQTLVDLEVGLRSGTTVTVASVKAENAYLKRRLLELERANAKLKERLGEVVGQDLLDVAPSDASLAHRIAELEQQLFEARETIREREEELEAARDVNRDLMRARNQGGA
jgi:hypothetical protein